MTDNHKEGRKAEKRKKKYMTLSVGEETDPGRYGEGDSNSTWNWEQSFGKAKQLCGSNWLSKRKEKRKNGMLPPIFPLQTSVAKLGGERIRCWTYNKMYSHKEEVWTEYSKCQRPGLLPSLHLFQQVASAKRYLLMPIWTPDEKDRVSSMSSVCILHVPTHWARSARPDPSLSPSPSRAPNPKRTSNCISAQTHHYLLQEFKGSVGEYPSLSIRGHRTLGML